MLPESGYWFGDLPPEWNAIRLKYILTEINDRSEDGIGEPLSMSQKYGIIKSSDLGIPNPASSYIGSKKVNIGDIVFNKLKAHLGVFAISPFEGLVSPDYAVYRVNKNYDPKFIVHLLRTDACINEFKKYITGVGAGLSRLYTSDLFNIIVPIPPIEEQHRIGVALDKVSKNVKAKNEEFDKLAELLNEYAKSYSSELIFGKKRS